MNRTSKIAALALAGIALAACNDEHSTQTRAGSGIPTGSLAQGIAATQSVTGNTTLPAGTSTATSGNKAPSISGTAASAATVGQGYSFQPQASDADTDKISFTISNKPAWASFDTTTGRLSGTPGSAHIGTFARIEIAATDGKAVTVLPAFTISVMAGGSKSVTLAWSAPTQNTDGSALTDLAGYRIHFGSSPNSYTNTITVENGSLNRYLVEGLSSGTYYFTVAAYNSAGTPSNFASEVKATL